MKHLHRVLFTVISFTISSCTHITLLGHESAYDVSAEFSGDPIAPVSLNAGFEGRSFAAVPPKEAVNIFKNLSVRGLPKGDVLSTLLELKIEKVPSDEVTGNVAFDYVTSGATGLAADAAAGSSPTSGGLELNRNPPKDGLEETKEISNQIKTITKDGKKTFLR